MVPIFARAYQYFEFILLATLSFARTKILSPYLCLGYAPVQNEQTVDINAPADAIPVDLDGVFLRIGPNPQLNPRANYHWFDGDGMVHAVRFLQGKCSYANRWVRTTRWHMERKLGFPTGLALGELVGIRGLIAVQLFQLRQWLGLVTEREEETEQPRRVWWWEALLRDGSSRLASLPLSPRSSFSSSSEQATPFAPPAVLPMLPDTGGSANTSLSFHAHRLLALNEGDLPYHLRVLCDGAVETIGRWSRPFVRRMAQRRASLATTDKDKDAATTMMKPIEPPSSSAPSPSPLPTPIHPAWGEFPFTAHPKRDPVTNELHAFGYRVTKAPFVQYGVLDAQGRLLQSPSILRSMRQPIMMHDFALSQHYAIFLDVPLVFDGSRMVAKNDMPVHFAPRGLRFVVRPRHGSMASEAARLLRQVGVTRDDIDPAFASNHHHHAGDDDLSDEALATTELVLERMRDDDTLLPPMVIMHTANAFETTTDTSTIRLYACIYRHFSLNLEQYDALTNPPEGQGDLVEFSLDLATRRVSMRQLHPDRFITDFPQVNWATMAHPCRYLYAATIATKSKTVKFDGVLKLNLDQTHDAQEQCLVGHVTFGEEQFGGEVLFVPRRGASEEDDGYLMTYVTDERDMKSFLVVYDAQTLKLVTRIGLPARVPYGFHALWIAGDEMKKQE